MENVFIFTYGTLMNGRRNYKKYLEGKVISIKKAYVLGELYHLENKDYPAFIKKDENPQKVYGEILEIPNDNKLLLELEELENCGNEDISFNEYLREYIRVYTMNDEVFGELPIYLYNVNSKPNQDDIMIRVDSGDWNEYKNR